jgi:UrcA family protein
MNTSCKFHRWFAAAAIGAFAAGNSVAVHADESSDVPHVTVKYGDLAVSTPQGAATLYQRIWSAAVTVCRPLDDRSLASKQARDACIHKAVVDAVAKVDQPALSAVYRAKHPESTLPALTARNR